MSLAIFVGQVTFFGIYFSCKKADAVKYCSWSIPLWNEICSKLSWYMGLSIKKVGTFCRVFWYPPFSMSVFYFYTSANFKKFDPSNPYPPPSCRRLLWTAPYSFAYCNLWMCLKMNAATAQRRKNKIEHRCFSLKMSSLENHILHLPHDSTFWGVV